MKKALYSSLVIILLAFTNCSSGNSGNQGNKTKDPSSDSAVTPLTTDAFKKLVYNYAEDKNWKYEGSLPAIIDFYADWCPPCHELSPLVEEIAKEYHGKIVVYKVDTGMERALAQSLGIANLPTLLYIPMTGQPKVTLGLIPKEMIVKTINEVLLTR